MGGLIAPDCPVCESAQVESFQRVEQRDYWRCQTCLATFLDRGQLPSAEQETELYRLHRNDPDDAGYRQFLDRLAQPLLARLSVASHGLDFGCGSGSALPSLLAARGHRVAGYDPLFAPDPSLLSRRYDFVACSEVVEHLHRPAQTFQKLWTLVRPGGWLAIMTTFQHDDARFRHWHYRRDPTHVVFYRPATFRHLAAGVGWSCEIPAPNVAMLQCPEARSLRVHG